MTTSTEDIVAQEQKDHVERRREMIEDDPDREVEQTDDDTTDPAAADEDGDPKEKALFDRSQYEQEGLAIQKIDGQPVDRIAIKFSGEVMLDRSDESDVALFNKLRLGRNVELRVAARVQRTTGAGATSRDGDLDVIVGTRTLKIDSVWVLDPENL